MLRNLNAHQFNWQWLIRKLTDFKSVVSAMEGRHFVRGEKMAKETLWEKKWIAILRMMREKKVALWLGEQTRMIKNDNQEGTCRPSSSARSATLKSRVSRL